jgi:hypothetical protein
MVGYPVHIDRRNSVVCSSGKSNRSPCRSGEPRPHQRPVTLHALRHTFAGAAVRKGDLFACAAAPPGPQSADHHQDLP